MNRWGILLALAGFALACWVVWQQDLQAVLALLSGAGLALLWIGPAHLPSVLLNAHAWGMMLPGRTRGSLGWRATLFWVRESINHLLPVGRIGGEVVAYRLMRRAGVRAAPAAGSLIGDLALSLVSQLAFALLGLALLAWAGASLGVAATVTSILVGAAAAAAAIFAVQGEVLSRVIGALNRMAADRLTGLAEASRKLDVYMRRLWRRPREMALCAFWQLLGWMAGALEIWVAAWALGTPISIADALLIEALIQTLISAAFVVPGALGVQEAGFIGLAVLVGLDPAAGAALAVARRLRDVVLFLPGLLAWAWLERR